MTETIGDRPNLRASRPAVEARLSAASVPHPPGRRKASHSLAAMLRLLDARTRSYAEVKPARPGLLRVRAHMPGDAAATFLTGLRVLLVADLRFRAAELASCRCSPRGHSRASPASR
jgi:hypothetical protein